MTTTVRLKLKRAFLLILGSLFAFSVLGIGFSMPELAGRYIAWRINHDSQGKVRLVDPMLLPGPGLSVKEVNFSDWGKPPISLSLTNITMQRTVSKEPFLVAVTGKGQIGSGEPRPLRLTGRVKGDFTSGIYQVSGLRVKIDKVGEINLSGQIETKGQYGKLSVNLAKISLSELKKSINLPDMPTEGLMDGQVYFTLRHEKDQWQAQSVDYCLSFQNLFFPQQQIPPLSGEVKGYYDFFAESGRLNQARIFTQTGGEISLSGTMGKKGFDFSFETKGLYLDDLLEALPQSIREKIGVRAGNLT